MFYKLKPFVSSSTFSISYKDPLKVPVQIEISKDTIYMTVHVEFDPVYLLPIDRTDTKDVLLKSKPEGYTYADAFVEGIKSHWAKHYIFEGTRTPVVVKMNVIRKDDPDAVFDPGQRFFLVRHTNVSKTSFVTSPVWRMGWGFLLTGCPEAAMINWSLTHPGTINMNDYSRISSFMSVASHEFGHVLGVGDAYGAHYRCFYEAPGTETYIMNNSGSVNPRELEMVLRAHETGKMQYFPYKVSIPRFLRNTLGKLKKK
ncbi:hypothetical protein SAMN06296952_0994 [Oscillospiraceae bacterium]|nr:hypothetical protein SAMN06296952_0994 [Oscillospiraceae bacterium]